MQFINWLENNEMQKSVLQQLADFIKTAGSRFSASQWLEDAVMQVYVRKSLRIIEDKRMTVLDIANIEVFNKGQGTGSQFFQ